MTSLTLKNIPEDLLQSLRRAAERERRSLTQQIIYLLETSLDDVPTKPSRVDVEAQVAEWRKLAGQWQSDLDPTTESQSIMKGRTGGREVEL